MENEGCCSEGGGCCSEGKGKPMLVLFLIVVVAVLLGSLIMNYAMKSDNQQSIYVSSQVEKNQISVSGDSKTEISPDTAKLSFGVFTKEKDAATAQSKNAEIIAKVKKALTDRGVQNSDIETTYFYTEPVYTSYHVCPDEELTCDPDDKIWDYKLTGYKTTHDLMVTTKNLDSVGGLLDAVVAAGANKVNDVSFTLSENKQKEIKDQLLVQAMVDAKTRAEKMAGAVGAKLLKPMYIAESYYYSPVSSYYSKGMDYMTEASAAPTEISQGKLEISASVSVTYELG